MGSEVDQKPLAIVDVVKNMVLGLFLYNSLKPGAACLRNSVTRISAVPVQHKYLYFSPYKANNSYFPAKS